MTLKKIFARFSVLMCFVSILPAVATASAQSILSHNATAFESPEAAFDGSNGLSYWLDKTFANKRIHVLKIDLNHPQVHMRASTSNERGLTPSEFAASSGAVAVINGDFFDGTKQPVGLAVGLGQLWPKSADTKDWSFLACTLSNDCIVDPYNHVTPLKPEWTTVVGGWQVLLDPGFEWTRDDDANCGEFCKTEHPRTVVGLSADRNTMWWVVVEGRQGSLTGLSLFDLTKVMLNLGAEYALNLDGGGSTGLILNGKRVNGRPFNEPAERRVANCLGITLGTP